MHRRPRPLALLATLALSCGGLLAPMRPAHAQAMVPDAGSALRETLPSPRRPAPSAETAAPAPLRETAPAAGPSFVLRRLRFVGGTAFSDAELQALAADHIGKPTTLADLEAIAQRVTERYRGAGYLLAQALVPAQEIIDGTVEISVLEGTVGRVRVDVDPKAPIDAGRVRAIAARLVPGRPLRQDALARSMLLLSDLPGIVAQAELESGEASGSTDLVIGVRPGRRWEAAFDFDNYGSRSVAEYRAGMQARWNSPSGVGDNLDLRLQYGAGGGLTFGRVGYERPVGADGHRLTVGASSLKYALGGNFAALDASGKADVVDLAWTYPFMRSRTSNLFGRSVLQYKKLQDRYGVFSLVNDKSIRSLSVGMTYERSDRLFGGGYANASLAAVLGELTLDTQRQRDDDDQALRSRGRFVRWNYAASRLNTLTPTFNLFTGIAGQFASKNLDSAEKTALGGPRGVRAYAPSEAAADEAHIATVELRYAPRQDLSLQAFYDWGWARINRDPPAGATANTVHRRGYGAGVFWGAPGGFTLRASLAWRDTGPGAADASDRRPRAYVQVGKAL